MVDAKIISGQRLLFFPERNQIVLKKKMADTIALGSELNNVACVVKGDVCHLTPAISDAGDLDRLKELKKGILTLVEKHDVKPKIIVCDKHPGFQTKALAKELADKYGAILKPVQHHHAHVASVALEHGLDDYVGIACDGLGYGEDDNIWGGEVFDVKVNGFRRIGHLEEQYQLGSDAATIDPRKMLISILSRFLDEENIIRLGILDSDIVRVLLRQLDQNFNTPKTTSTGRVLDAAGAFLGLHDKKLSTAILLDNLATEPYEIDPIINSGILMTTPIFEFLYNNRKKDNGRLAATVLIYIAKGLYELARRGKPIVFSGGVAYNSIITSYMLKKKVLLNKNVPPGDPGICLGQAYIANS